MIHGPEVNDPVLLVYQSTRKPTDLNQGLEEGAHHHLIHKSYRALKFNACLDTVDW